MNQATPGPFGHQQDPEKIVQATAHIEAKATEVKKTIEQLIFMLDLQDKVPWPEMLDKFSSLASGMTQLQSVLKKSALPSGGEDHGLLLRTHLLVPHLLSMDIDPALQEQTEKRLHFWNHDVCPDYLRTKLTPELETEEAQIDCEKNVRGADVINKQITSMNKHADALLTNLTDSTRSQVDNRTDTPAYNDRDTQTLVRAVVNGESLRPSRAAEGAQPGAAASAGSTASATSRAPSTASPPLQRR